MEKTDFAYVLTKVRVVEVGNLTLQSRLLRDHREVMITNIDSWSTPSVVHVHYRNHMGATAVMSAHTTHMVNVLPEGSCTHTDTK